jgi:hypothetical protein
MCVFCSTWLQKCVVMCILQRLLQGLRSELVVRFYWATLSVTFIVSFIVTFVECHPFKLYWQVVPNPGKEALNSRGTMAKLNQELAAKETFN